MKRNEIFETSSKQNDEMLKKLQVKNSELEMQNKELRQKEMRYRILAENMRDAIWVLDTETMRYTFFSPSIQKIFGYVPEELMGSSLESSLPPEVAVVVSETIRMQKAAFLAGKAPQDKYYTEEMQGVRKDGSLVWVEVVTCCYLNQATGHVEIHGFTRDISARKQAEEVAARHVLVMEALYTTSLEITVESDLDHLLKNILIKAAELLGCKMGHLYLLDENGSTLRMQVGLQNSGYAENVEIHLGQGISGRVAQTGEPLIVEDQWEWEHCLPDFRNGPMRRVLGVPLKAQGKCIGAILTGNDFPGTFSMEEVRIACLFADQASITIVRAQLMDDLRKNEQRYRELVEDANVIILMVAPDGTIEFMNEYGLAFFGYGNGELIGRPLQDIISQQSVTVGINKKKKDSQAKNDGIFHARIQQENITRSGRHVWVDWTVRQRHDSLSGAVSQVLVGVDVTATRRMQEEQKRHYERKRRQDFLNEAVSGRMSSSEIAESGKQLGVLLEEPLVCVTAVFSIDSEQVENHWFHDSVEHQEFIDSLVDVLQFLDIGAVWQTIDGFAVLKTLSAKTRKSLLKLAGSHAETVSDIASRYSRGIRIRYGASCSSQSAESLAALYQQARAAVVFGPATSPDRTLYYWHDLGCYQFVVREIGSAITRQFVEEQIGLLHQVKGEKNQEQLLSTLKEIVAGRSIQEMADKLHVHPKTIYYRRKTLEDILGVHLDSQQTLMNLSVALTIAGFDKPSL